KACLSRRSAVVRGAVDTGCRRNYLVAVCSGKGVEMQIRGGKMSKLRMLLFVAIGILAASMTAFARGAEAGDNAASVNKYRALAAGIGFAIAVLGGAIGQ